MATQPNTNTGQVDPEGQQLNADGTPITPEVTPEVTPEKLYAGKYKTPEELESAYASSNSEATRMAQEIKRLNTLIQKAPPQQKEAIQDKIDDLSKYFDPETAKILTTYTKDKIAEAIKTERQSWKGDTDFVKQVTDVWEETKKLYPEAANPQSKLYLRANEILFERNLAEISEDGTVQLLTPFAYRIAVEAASAELGRQAPANAETKNKKGRAVQVAGKGSIIRTGGKLSYAEYMKLDDDAKDAYDKSTTGG
ncbi:hypothetical protein LCGC14_1044180 [marine sediment metagenome]|uniref:Uncharacterized protein n=1 Tax=marine sediment metagenome TaxID=412755 RepID=A0A0F9NCK2_9ZZZZ